MTDEQRVKAVYPDAKIARDHHSAYYLFTKLGAGGRISEYVGSEELAWKSAASKLPEPTPPTETQTIHDWVIWKDSNGVWWKSDGKQIARVFEVAAPTERVETSPEIADLKKLREWMEGYRSDAVRPDEWTLQGWIKKCDEIIAAVAPSPAGESQEEK